MSGIEDESTRATRRYGKGYSDRHPVPTVQKYRHHQDEIKSQEAEGNVISGETGGDPGDPSKTRKAFDSVKAIAKGEDEQPSGEQQPYPTSSRNDVNRPLREDRTDEPQSDPRQDSSGKGQDGSSKKQDEGKEQKSAAEVASGHLDPKQKRKDMKKIKRHGGGREVTDPVTHLPVLMRDMTDKDLASAPENELAAGSHHRNTTGGTKKSDEEMDDELKELQKGFAGMQKLFPPPDFHDTKKEMMKTYRLALRAGLGTISAIAVFGLFLISLQIPRSTGAPAPKHTSYKWKKHAAEHVSWWSFSWSWASIALTLAVTGAAAFGVTIFISHWLKLKVESIFEDETWDASRKQEVDSVESEAELPESVAWLNSLLASVWPLINPELFTSLVDMLEDVMQASLPKFIRMVSIDDMGQGSEAFRILGVRWLPTAAAGQSVDTEGNLKPANKNGQKAKDNDRSGTGEGQIDEAADDDQDQSQEALDKKQKEQEQQAIREGLEAEEGDFVNLELAFAYRARSSGKSIQSKAKNAHLYLKFYLPGDIAIPVWVEVKGIIGIMRVRLQLTPDPPFFDLCTLTFLGQPRANLSCVPLSKHSLNLMDVPLISSFVQSAVDAALAEYVAPKSLTLGLKDMLVGDDFKKDTTTRGVIVVNIKHAVDFKDGDGGIGPLQGSSDSYVTVSWGKFGKPMASTRVIVNEQKPVWNEWAYILVSAEEVNAGETLRLQLWDSDKYTADDDLGRVEIPLKSLMHGSDTKNKMHDREDHFTAEDPDEKMPGSIAWSVGYFEKAHIQPCQFKKQKVDSGVHDREGLKKQVEEGASNKLREAVAGKDRSKELHQQTVQDYKEKETEMMISAPPPDGLPSGVVSIQIHNITGLERVKPNKRKAQKGEDREDEAEQGDDMPDSYCTIILNHKKVYRTRTKPRNAKPFFNAGTERFVPDWKAAELIVSVRDAREGEEDPLLGIVYLPLRKVFEKRSQVMESYPLAGGIGYGRARISLVWRSLELQLPKELGGWDYGTVEIKVPVKWKGNTADDKLHVCRIKLQTKLGRVKLKSHHDGTWRPKHETDTDSMFLGVTKRYASPLFIEFRKSVIGPDHSPAFAAFWLSDIPDEEEKTVTVKVWKGGKDNIKAARSSYKYEPADEQPLGEIELTLKFWRGLSGYHKRYAHKSNNTDLRDVMETLDTIADEKMGVDENEAEDDNDSDDSSSDSSDDDWDSDYEKIGESSRDDVEKKKMLRKAGRDSSSDSDNNQDPKNPIKKLKNKTTSLVTGHNDGQENGSRGLRDQIQDYKKHHKQLHRKHRGVMQWKGARTLDWMAHKADQGKGKVGDLFKHRDKDQGIETEV